MVIPKQYYRVESEQQSTPFIKINASYWNNEENKVRIVDHFSCTLADTMLQFDDEFLVNIGWSLSQVTELFEDKTSGVHPLFMKNSICDILNEELEMVNQEMSLADWSNYQQQHMFANKESKNA